jgi:diacylglycerol kinase (ATP)
LFHAIVGLVHSIKTQKNLKIILACAIIVGATAVALHFSYLEMFLIVYASFCVIITELINTSIELVVDLITKEKKLRAMLAKDVAAAATLIAVIQALIIGAIIIFHQFHK